jgi:hypothetical protein
VLAKQQLTEIWQGSVCHPVSEASSCPAQQKQSVTTILKKDVRVSEEHGGMTDHGIEVSEQDNRSEATLQTDAKEIHNNQHAPEDRIAGFSSNLLERGNSIIYAIVGICFFFAGLFALGYSF